MFKKTILFCTVIGNLLLYSCMPDPSGENENYDESEATNDTLIEVVEEQDKKDSIMQIKAQFEEFVMGDAPHYKFRDTKGKVWDFGGCEEKDYEFAMKLQMDKQDETNQGWATNPELKGGWFKIRYAYRNQSLYQDGPKGRVPVILRAEKMNESN